MIFSRHNYPSVQYLIHAGYFCGIMYATFPLALFLQALFLQALYQSFLHGVATTDISNTILLPILIPSGIERQVNRPDTIIREDKAPTHVCIITSPADPL